MTKGFLQRSKSFTIHGRSANLKNPQIPGHHTHFKSSPFVLLLETRSSSSPSPAAPLASSYNIKHFLADSPCQPPDKNRVNHMPDAIRVFFNIVEQFQLFERIPHGVDRSEVIRAHVFCRYDLLCWRPLPFCYYHTMVTITWCKNVANQQRNGCSVTRPTQDPPSSTADTSPQPYPWPTGSSARTSGWRQCSDHG